MSTLSQAPSHTNSSSNTPGNERIKTEIISSHQSDKEGDVIQKGGLKRREDLPVIPRTVQIETQVISSHPSDDEEDIC